MPRCAPPRQSACGLVVLACASASLAVNAAVAAVNVSSSGGGSAPAHLPATVLQRLGFEVEFDSTRLVTSGPMLIGKLAHKRTRAHHSLFVSKFFNLTIEDCYWTEHPLCSVPELVTRPLYPGEVGAMLGEVATWLDSGPPDTDMRGRRFLNPGEAWDFTKLIVHGTVELPLRSVPQFFMDQLLAEQQTSRPAARETLPSSSTTARARAAYKQKLRIAAEVHRMCRGVSEAYCGLLLLILNMGDTLSRPVPARSTSFPRRAKYMTQTYPLPVMVRSNFADLFHHVQNGMSTLLKPILLDHVAEFFGAGECDTRRLYPDIPLTTHESNLEADYIEVASMMADQHPIRTLPDAVDWIAANVRDAERVFAARYRASPHRKVLLPANLTVCRWVEAMAEGRDLLSDRGSPLAPLVVFKAMGAYPSTGGVVLLEIRQNPKRMSEVKLRSHLVLHDVLPLARMLLHSSASTAGVWQSSHEDFIQHLKAFMESVRVDELHTWQFMGMGMGHTATPHM